MLLCVASLCGDIFSRDLLASASTLQNMHNSIHPAKYGYESSAKTPVGRCNRNKVKKQKNKKQQQQQQNVFF